MILLSAEALRLTFSCCRMRFLCYFVDNLSSMPFASFIAYLRKADANSPGVPRSKAVYLSNPQRVSEYFFSVMEIFFFEKFSQSVGQ